MADAVWPRSLEVPIRPPDLQGFGPTSGRSVRESAADRAGRFCRAPPRAGGPANISGQAPKPVIFESRKPPITYRTQQMIWKHHGPKTRVMVIGRAGETKSRIACILTDTGDASGQGGFGGVMGSKNLKAIAVRGTGTVNVARPKDLMEITHHIQKLFSSKSLRSDPYQPAYHLGR